MSGPALYSGAQPKDRVSGARPHLFNGPRGENEKSRSWVPYVGSPGGQKPGSTCNDSRARARGPSPLQHPPFPFLRPVPASVRNGRNAARTQRSSVRTARSACVRERSMMLLRLTTYRQVRLTAGRSSFRAVQTAECRPDDQLTRGSVSSAFRTEMNGREGTWGARAK